jgi:hypothetical protein
MDHLLRAVSKRSWWQQILILVCINILIVQIAGIAGTKVLVPRIGWSLNSGTRPAGASMDTLQGRFVRWDSGYYLKIAKDGYASDGPERAFFPLFPLLIHLFSGASGLSLLWSGFIISILCLTCAALLLYQWVQIDYGPEIGLWSVVALCVFPLSFFFSSLYAESLFLTVSLAAIYFARRGQFVLSGFAIALAGATRLPAFLLAIPYILEFWVQHDFSAKRSLQFGLGGLVAPLGMAGYFVYLGHQVGDANIHSMYGSIQSGTFDRTIAYPWVTVMDGLRAALWGTNINSDWFSRFTAWHDLSYAVLGMALAVWSVYHFRLSLSAFMIASMIFLFTNHGPFGYAFFSMPRYIAALFPIYPTLALLTSNWNPRYRLALIGVAIIMLGFLSAWFATGRWVA